MDATRIVFFVLLATSALPAFGTDGLLFARFGREGAASIVSSAEAGEKPVDLAYEAHFANVPYPVLCKEADDDQVCVENLETVLLERYSSQASRPSPKELTLKLADGKQRTFESDEGSHYTFLGHTPKLPYYVVGYSSWGGESYETKLVHDETGIEVASLPGYPYESTGGTYVAAASSRSPFEDGAVLDVWRMQGAKPRRICQFTSTNWEAHGLHWRDDRTLELHQHLDTLVNEWPRPVAKLKFQIEGGCGAQISEPDEKADKYADRYGSEHAVDSEEEGLAPAAD